MRNACGCGCGLPVGEGHVYVDQNHKQRAYRARIRNQRRALSRYVAGELFELIGDEKATQVVKLLDTVCYDKYNFAVDKAIAILIVEIRTLKNRSIESVE